MLKRSLFAAAIAAATSVSAHAGEINYNYIELGLDRGDFGNGDLIQDGRNLSGSFAIADNFYIAGTYRNSDVDTANSFIGLDLRSETDIDYWNINFGYRQTLNPDNDFIAELGFERSAAEQNFYVNDVLQFHSKSNSSNIRGVIGLRTSINDRWETTAKLGLKGKRDGYVDVQPHIELGVAYKINPTWAVDFDTKMDAFGAAQYSLGVRAYFGTQEADSATNETTTNTEFSYTYIQAGLSGFEHFYDDNWTAGYDLRGSYGFADNFYVHARFAQYNNGQYELHDEQQYEIGFGYHTEIAPSNDFVVGVSRGVVDSGCSIFECTRETGYTFSAGIRTAVTENLQVKAMLGYNDGGDRNMYDRKTTANIDISYVINEKFDAFFDTKLLNRYESFYTFGMRFKF